MENVPSEDEDQVTHKIISQDFEQESILKRHTDAGIKQHNTPSGQQIIYEETEDNQSKIIIPTLEKYTSSQSSGAHIPRLVNFVQKTPFNLWNDGDTSTLNQTINKSEVPTERNQGVESKINPGLVQKQNWDEGQNLVYLLDKQIMKSAKNQFMQPDRIFSKRRERCTKAVLDVFDYYYEDIFSHPEGDGSDEEHDNTIIKIQSFQNSYLFDEDKTLLLLTPQNYQDTDRQQPPKQQPHVIQTQEPQMRLFSNKEDFLRIEQDYQIVTDRSSRGVMNTKAVPLNQPGSGMISPKSIDTGSAFKEGQGTRLSDVQQYYDVDPNDDDKDLVDFVAYNSLQEFHKPEQDYYPSLETLNQGQLSDGIGSIDLNIEQIKSSDCQKSSLAKVEASLDKSRQIDFGVNQADNFTIETAAFKNKQSSPLSQQDSPDFNHPHLQDDLAFNFQPINIETPKLPTVNALKQSNQIRIENTESIQNLSKIEEVKSNDQSSNYGQISSRLLHGRGRPAEDRSVSQSFIDSEIILTNTTLEQDTTSRSRSRPRGKMNEVQIIFHTKSTPNLPTPAQPNKIDRIKSQPNFESLDLEQTPSIGFKDLVMLNESNINPGISDQIKMNQALLKHLSPKNTDRFPLGLKKQVSNDVNMDVTNNSEQEDVGPYFGKQAIMKNQSKAKLDSLSKNQAKQLRPSGANKQSCIDLNISGRFTPLVKRVAIANSQSQGPNAFETTAKTPVHGRFIRKKAVDDKPSKLGCTPQIGPKFSSPQPKVLDTSNELLSMTNEGLESTSQISSKYLQPNSDPIINLDIKEGAKKLEVPEGTMNLVDVKVNQIDNKTRSKKAAKSLKKLSTTGSKSKIPRIRGTSPPTTQVMSSLKQTKPTSTKSKTIDSPGKKAKKKIHKGSLIRKNVKNISSPMNSLTKSIYSKKKKNLMVAYGPNKKSKSKISKSPSIISQETASKHNFTASIGNSTKCSSKKKISVFKSFDYDKNSSLHNDSSHIKSGTYSDLTYNKSTDLSTKQDRNTIDRIPASKKPRKSVKTREHSFGSRHQKPKRRNSSVRKKQIIYEKRRETPKNECTTPKLDITQGSQGKFGLMSLSRLGLDHKSIIDSSKVPSKRLSQQHPLQHIRDIDEDLVCIRDIGTKESLLLNREMEEICDREVQRVNVSGSSGEVRMVKSSLQQNMEKAKKVKPHQIDDDGNEIGDISPGKVQIPDSCLKRGSPSSLNFGDCQPPSSIESTCATSAKRTGVSSHKKTALISYQQQIKSSEQSWSQSLRTDTAQEISSITPHRSFQQNRIKSPPSHPMTSLGTHQRHKLSITTTVGQTHPYNLKSTKTKRNQSKSTNNKGGKTGSTLHNYPMKKSGMNGFLSLNQRLLQSSTATTHSNFRPKTGHVFGHNKSVFVPNSSQGDLSQDKHQRSVGPIIEGCGKLKSLQ